MRMLILGGTGILSSDFTKKAISQHDEVYVMNRGKHTSLIDKSVHNIVADLRKETIEVLREKVSMNRYDVVVDFLSFNPEQMKKTIDVISGLCDQYVFISSATVYKNVENKRIIEDDEIGNEQWSYAYNKSLCERTLTKLDINYTIIRPYVTYGQTRIPFQMIPNSHFTLLERIIEEKPVVLFENGKANCTLTSTKDFAEVLYRLLKNPKAYREVFHITSPFEQSWYDVYLELCRVLEKPCLPISANISDIESFFPEYRDLLLGDKGTNRRFDNSKVMNALGFEYEFTIDVVTGLRSSVEHYLADFQNQYVDCKFDGECDYFVYKKTGKRLSMLKNGVHDNPKNYYLMTNGFTRCGVNIMRRLRRKNDR